MGITTARVIVCENDIDKRSVYQGTDPLCKTFLFKVMYFYRIRFTKTLKKPVAVEP